MYGEVYITGGVMKFFISSTYTDLPVPILLLLYLPYIPPLESEALRAGSAVWDIID